MIYVDNLVVEVTRRCNMGCAHCLRGEAENIDISEAILETVAGTIQPGAVTFSGGEPSLNVAAIRRYFELAERYGHEPSYFYVATNGKTNQEELAFALLKAYPLMEEPEMCDLTMSDDPFHDDVDRYKTQIFEGLSFYRPDDNRHPRDDFSPNSVLAVGRAADNGLGRNPGPIIANSLADIVEWEDDESPALSSGVRINELYISANGNVVDVCDVSYEEIDEYKLCHISELENKLDELAVVEMAAAV